MAQAASIARQAIEKDIAAVSTLIINPGSAQLYETTHRDGLNNLFKEVGATILANACGPCIGQWKRFDEDTDKKNTIITSYNRNFAKRADGNPNTFAFVASPEIVMALTLAGDLCFNPLKDRLMTHEG